MTVYLDELFLVNLLMDWLVLWAVGSLAQQSSPRWRLALAALLGAVYAVAILFPEMYWLTALPVKIAWSLLMLLLAFSFVNWRSYLKLIVYFYLCAFVLGGASLASMYLFGQPAMPTWSGIALVETDFRLMWLAVGSGMVVAAVYCLRGRLRQDIPAAQRIITATLCFRDKRVTITLLADSGHSLTDPLTGRSVLVAEQNILLPLFSDRVQQILSQTTTTEADCLLNLTHEPDMAGRWRIIPYQTIGQQGLLLGFRPDQILLQLYPTTKTLQNITVALSAQTFSSGGEYQGLISLDLL